VDRQSDKEPIFPSNALSSFHRWACAGIGADYLRNTDLSLLQVIDRRAHYLGGCCSLSKFLEKGWWSTALQ